MEGGLLDARKVSLGPPSPEEALQGPRGALLLSGLLPRVARSGELLVRHLLMPGHLECCTRPALEWLRANVPGATVNLMTGYHPFSLKGASGAMSSQLTAQELKRSVDLFESMGFPSAMIDGQPQ